MGLIVVIEGFGVVEEWGPKVVIEGWGVVVEWGGE